MGYEPKDYWAESLFDAFDVCGALAAWEGLTDEQRASIVSAMDVSHENYGMAFYSPPASDRLNEIEREWKAKYDALKREFEAYQNRAETAVKIALRQPRDARISIGEYGEVRKHDGRSDRIQ